MEKKAEEAAKQAEIDAGRKAAIDTFNETDTEEYFPKKADAHSVRQARVLSTCGRSLFNELYGMAGNSVEEKKLGDKIWKAYSQQWKQSW